MDFIIEHRFDKEKNGWLVDISGEVDIFNSDKMKSRFLELIASEKADLYICCRDLEYIDSTALGALVAVLKHVKAYGGEIYLKSIKPSIAKLFKITNLNQVFIIEGDVNE
jgi:anti-sigma B factor antagonist